jgi:Nif-specific regulatory protein
VAQSSSTILIRGESGTGKGPGGAHHPLGVAAPRGPVHRLQLRGAARDAVESELFGHEKGAFTGATGQKPGRFELAHRGTIFLDEIGKVVAGGASRSCCASSRIANSSGFGGTKTLRTDTPV